MKHTALSSLSVVLIFFLFTLISNNSVLQVASENDHPTNSSNPTAPPEMPTPSSTTKAGVLLASTSNVRLNEIQMVGVHNSYHVQPRKPLLDLLKSTIPDTKGWEYSHKPLPSLLAAGVRTFELDVFYDPRGGLFANRDGLRFIRQPTASNLPALNQPGFKVLHVQDIDFESTCLTLKACLRSLYAWSLKNPRHLPVIVKIEAKTGTIEQIAGGLAAFLLKGAAVPLPVTAASLAALETEILSVVPRWKIVRPDNVRRGMGSLLEAVQKLGWPRVSGVAGKFLFVLVPDSAVETYRQNNPTLQGKLMFTGPTTAGTSDAIFITPERISLQALQQAQAQKIIVLSRSDWDTNEARNNDFSGRNFCLTKGVHLIHSDYPAAERPNPFGTSYFVALPGNAKARCNPVTATRSCNSLLLREPLVP